MRFILLLSLLFLLPSCKTERTVLAGPQKVSMGGYNDVNPNVTNDQMATAMAATGQTQTQGGAGFNDRFSFDSGGYGSQGLNIMSGKMFGDSKAKDMKEFTQTKDYLTKRYGGTKAFGTKENSAGGARSWLASRESKMSRSAYESGSTYNGTRVLENTRNRSDGRTLFNRGAREDGRTSLTKDFYPARKVLDSGADAPKMIGDAPKKKSDAVWNLIRSRPRDNPASVQEIRDLLGKRD